MPSMSCVNAVDEQRINLAQAAGLPTMSTGLFKYLTSQVFLPFGYTTAYTTSLKTYEQLKIGLFSLLYKYLSTLSPAPTNTNIIHY